MMMRGLSDSTKSRLQRLRNAGALGDTDFALQVKHWLDVQDKIQQTDVMMSAVKMLQAFISPTMYSDVYKDEIEESKMVKLREAAPKSVDMSKLKPLLSNFHEVQD